MPGKKTIPETPSSSTTVLDSGRLALASSVRGLESSMNGFKGAVERFNEMTSKTIPELDQILEIKRKEFEGQQEEFDHTLKKRKIQVDLELEEHRSKAALAVIKEMGMEAVEISTLENIKSQLQALKDQRENELVEQHKKLTEEGERKLRAALAAKELEHKAQTAELKARVDQFPKEVIALQQTIKEQREEIKEQRRLTQSVAEAGKQGAIHQAFGGKQ